MPTKQAICAAPTPATPLGQIPDDVRRFAQRLRAVFGPGVTLKYVVLDEGPVIGNPAWAPLLEDDP